VTAHELSRPIKIKAITEDPVVIEAGAAERDALARRFGLAGVDRLHAEIALEPLKSGIRASGTLNAEIRQTCAVSGEDFPVRVRENVDLKFVKEGTLAAALGEADLATGKIEIELTAESGDEIEYAGDAFDLGEAIAQTLGLSIDPYAEGPGADDARKAAGIAAEGEQEGPLAAALAALRKD
jgi:hypothetical protein